MQSRLLLAFYSVLLFTALFSSSSIADSLISPSFSFSTAGSSASSSSDAATDPASQVTWYDGDQLRTFWISPFEAVVFGDERLVQTPDEMARVARETLPSGVILDVSDTLARLRVPTAVADHLETVQLPPGAQRVAPVFYSSRDPADDQPYIPTGEVIVVFNSALNASEAAAWGEAHGVQLAQEVGVANGFIFSCSDDDACLETSRNLYHDPSTRYAYPNWLKPRQTRLFGNADLAITKTASASLVPFGDNITFTVAAVNHGPDVARSVTIADALPPALTLVSASNSNGSCSTFRGISCSIPSLNISNSATVSATSTDPNLANNTGTAIVTVLSDASAPNDPLFSSQWHLENRGQGGGLPGEDVNVLPVWADYKGSANQIIAIVDDGVEIGHEDLAPNVVPGLSYDFVSNDHDPTAGTHGTAVAGIAAAAGFNGLGVSGVAPEAGLVGIRLLSNSGATDANEAAALIRSYDVIAAYNNSWGPADDGKRLDGPGPLAQVALADAVAKGRGGKGNIYCWAGGNGGDNDNANYDGYANSRYTIAVAASTHTGKRASYSEKGANLLVNAPSSSGALGVTTTDRSGTNGYDPGHYTSGFGGTSAAAPMVCGVVALMLQANPELSWRDVKYLLATTATRNDPADADWKQNGAGHWVNHKYGFGRVNASAAVAAADDDDWTPLNNGFISAFSSSVNQPILDNREVLSTINVAMNAKVEFVEVALDATHSDWGDLELVLTSPAGGESLLAEAHNAGTPPSPFNGWVYTSERHLDESSAGVWTLRLRDRTLGNTGQFKNWTLRLYMKYEVKWHPQ